MKRPLKLDVRRLALPPGTRVVLLSDEPTGAAWVCKAGTVARVEEAQHPTYVLSTTSGHTLTLPRERFVVQKARMKEAVAERAWAAEHLMDHVILEVVLGSVAWGLAGEHSDVDLRGAFLLPFSLHAGLFDTPDTLEPPGAEATYWEAGKVVRLGLRGEANVLEMLHSPIVRRASPAGELLRNHRHLFASRKIRGSFGRYAISQFDKMGRKLEQRQATLVVLDEIGADPHITAEAMRSRLATRLGVKPHAAEVALRAVVHSHHDRGDIARRHFPDLVQHLLAHPAEPEPYRPKNAYNLIRLLHSGIRWMREGEPMMEVTNPAIRARLLAIKGGGVPLGDVIAEAHTLASELDDATETSHLPAEPDAGPVDELLRRLRTLAARRHFHLDLPAVRVSPPPEPRPVRHEVPWDLCRQHVREAGVDVVICAITGAHAYGFPSPDSDVDLKGIHLLPARAVLGLDTPAESLDRTEVREGVELDLTLNEAAGVLRLLIKGNGNMLERLGSPYRVLPVEDAKAERRADELTALAMAGLHRGSLQHYLGFFRQCAGRARTHPSIKAWLYAYRVALTGTHLLRSAEIICDLPTLLEHTPLPHVHELIAAKREGDEHGGVELVRHLTDTVVADLPRLEAALLAAEQSSPLPPACPNAQDLDAWLRFWRTEPAEATATSA